MFSGIGVSILSILFLLLSHLKSWRFQEKKGSAVKKSGGNVINIGVGGNVLNIGIEGDVENENVGGSAANLKVGGDILNKDVKGNVINKNA